ncbi:hypothetical protein [Deminuibacter soli]|uniref:Uncharacterized protein n=1 Tax=Deminuibacter soli TaxID=2291815 RepID=A0A3E1NG49_9BACT|nr:hypothetical protein [Deminuibacter soli]RFM26935.1 hypothetical protein DXN05_18295 [Deminuibacter soli]
MRNPYRQVNLHIEELVLHGFAPHEAPYIGAAVEAALAGMLQQQGLPPELAMPAAIEALRAHTIQMAPGQSAAATGTQVAAAVMGGLHGSPKPR